MVAAAAANWSCLVCVAFAATQDAVRDGTTAWYNANNASATSTVRSAFGGCVLPCDASINFESGCCDQLWLPQIDLPNLLNFDYQVCGHVCEGGRFYLAWCFRLGCSLRLPCAGSAGGT